MKQKVLFVAQKMAVGGIASALVNLLELMCRTQGDEYEITLFTFSGGALLERIPSAVKVEVGGRGLRVISSSIRDVLKSRNVADIVARLWYMAYAKVFGSDKVYRRLLKRCKDKTDYDFAISYFNDVTTARFSRGGNMYVSDYVNARSKIGWIHTDPELCRFDGEYCRNIYKNFDKIYCVSKGVKDKFDKLVPEYVDRTEVFYNVFPEDEIVSRAVEFVPFEKCGCDIVTVGRIDNATKRIDGIVRLCKRLKDEGVSGFKWRIVGDGPDLNGNTALAEELGVLDVLEFVGEAKNPYPYIKNSDIFGLFSAYEGFPMVIGEALILGTTIVTTEYAAAKEQIMSQQGKICKDDEAFYQTLKGMIKGN